MSTLSLMAILLCFASAFGFLNERLLHLPSTVGLILVTLLASLCVIGLDAVVPSIALKSRAQEILGLREFPDFLLNGALSFMLFAGALQVDLAALSLLATVGVVIATLAFGSGMWLVFQLVGMDVPLVWCMVLGAVLAPTDPIAVAGILARVGLPKRLEAVLAGESLFNDGVGVVVFTALLGFATMHGNPSGLTLALDFCRQAGGGLILGGITGWIAYEMMRRIDAYPVEIMISLALTASTYVLANALAVSGPIAVVVSGLLIGNRAIRYAMSETTRQNLRLFWSVIDDILNAVLFLLLGFEVLGLTFELKTIVCAVLAIPLAIVVRAFSVIAPVYWLHLRNPNLWRGAAVLTWAGLRGGISVALVLSLPQTSWRANIILVCYAVVVFTIVVQGLTIERVIRRLYPSPPTQGVPQP